MLPARRAKQKSLDESTRRRNRKNLGHDTSFAKDKQTDCSICLETVSVRGKLGVCNHWFCFQCIHEWSKMTNTCPLCKLRFRCITRINLNHWASPGKKFRIQDKDQSLDVTAEDAEIALALENEETSSESDQNDSDFTMEQEQDDVDDSYNEGSFIDDADLTQDENVNFSLGHYLQQANTLTRSPYAFRSSRGNSGRSLVSEEEIQPLQRTRRSRNARVPQERHENNHQETQSSETDRPMVGGRRKRRHLNCPDRRGRHSQPSARPSATVTGWINMAGKTSQRENESNSARSYSHKSSDDDDDSDSSGNIVKRKPRKITHLVSSDEENEDSKEEQDSDVTEMDSEDFSCDSPSVVSSQNSATSSNPTYVTRFQSDENEAVIEPRSPSVVSSQNSAGAVAGRINNKKQSQRRYSNRADVARTNDYWTVSEDSSENKRPYLRSSVCAATKTSSRRSKRVVLRPNYAENFKYSTENSEYSDEYIGDKRQRLVSQSYRSPAVMIENCIGFSSWSQNETGERGSRVSRPLAASSAAAVSSYTCTSRESSDIDIVTKCENVTRGTESEKENEDDDLTYFTAAVRPQQTIGTFTKRQKSDTAHFNVRPSLNNNIKNKEYRFKRVTYTDKYSNLRHSDTNNTSSSQVTDSNFSASSDDDTLTSDNEEFKPRGIFAATPQEKPRFRSVSNRVSKTRRSRNTHKLF